MDPAKIMPLVTKYFGPITSKGKSPRVRTEEPTPEYYKRTISQNFNPPYIEKRVTGKAATNPNVTSCSTFRRSGTTTCPRSSCSAG